MPYSNNLYYRIYDGSPNQFTYPVVLLHGSGGSHLAWPSEYRRIPGQRVISVDLPGHGNSNEAACQSMDALVKRLRIFLLDLQIFQVTLVGHSLGAALALQYAAAYPKCVRKMMMLACGSWFTIQSQLLDALINSKKKHFFIEQFSQIAFDPSFPQARRRAILQPLNKMRASMLIADLSICAAQNMNGLPGKINCPVCLVSGSSDKISHPAAIQQLAHDLPDADIKILPKCGHMLLYEKKPLVSQILHDFLESDTQRKKEYL